MIPKLSPTEPTRIWLCAVLGIDPRVFDRNTGCRKNSYAKYPEHVRQRTRVWAVMRAVWGWSYPTIAYVTDSPNHSTVMDGLERQGYQAPGVLEELARWAHDHYDKLGEYAPPLPTYTLNAAPVVRPAPRPVAPKIGRKPGHGYECECGLCVPLRATADRLAARPNLRVDALEPVIRPFYREALRRKEAV